MSMVAGEVHMVVMEVNLLDTVELMGGPCTGDPSLSYAGRYGGSFSKDYDPSWYGVESGESYEAMAPSMERFDLGLS